MHAFKNMDGTKHATDYMNKYKCTMDQTELLTEAGRTLRVQSPDGSTFKSFMRKMTSRPSS